MYYDSHDIEGTFSILTALKRGRPNLSVKA